MLQRLSGLCKRLDMKIIMIFKIHLVHDLKEYQAADIKITEKEKSISIVDKISELEKNVIEKQKINYHYNK